jgi:hypothetical protein
LRAVQSLVSGQAPAHLVERAVEEPRDVRLRQAERLGHFGLRPLHEEPLEDDPSLP